MEPFSYRLPMYQQSSWKGFTRHRLWKPKTIPGWSRSCALARHTIGVQDDSFLIAGDVANALEGPPRGE